MDTGSSTPISNPISLMPCALAQQSAPNQLCFSGLIAPSCALSYAAFYCNVSLDRSTWHTSPRARPDLCALVKRLVEVPVSPAPQLSAGASASASASASSAQSEVEVTEAPRLSPPVGLPADAFFSASLSRRTVQCLLAPVPLIATPRTVSAAHMPPIRLRVAIQLCKQLDLFRPHRDDTLDDEEALDHLNLHCPERFNRREKYLVGRPDYESAPRADALPASTALPLPNPVPVIVYEADDERRARRARAARSGRSEEAVAARSTASILLQTPNDEADKTTTYVSLTANFEVQLDANDAGYWLCRARVEVDCEQSRQRQLYSQSYWQWPFKSSTARPATGAPNASASTAGAANAGGTSAAVAAKCGYERAALYQHTVLSSSVLVYRSPPLHTRVLVGGSLLLVLISCVCVWTWRGSRRCWREHQTLCARFYRARLTRLNNANAQRSSNKSQSQADGFVSGSRDPPAGAHLLRLPLHLRHVGAGGGGGGLQLHAHAEEDESESIEMDAQALHANSNANARAPRPIYELIPRANTLAAGGTQSYTRRYPS